MKLFITAKANAKENRVERLDNTHFKVFVKAVPKDGKANQAIIAALSEYFSLPKSRISVASGLASKTKIVELL